MGCSQPEPVPPPKPVPNYCLLTEDIRITQVQFDLLVENAAHVLRYIVEQRETRLAECPDLEGDVLESPE